MQYPDFIGGSYTLASKNASADESMNLYPSKVDYGGKTGLELRGKPGLQLFCTLAKSPGRGLWAGDNRLFAVADDTLYEISSAGTATSVGTINSASTPVTIRSNGRQLMIVSGSQVWIATGTSVVRPSYTTLNSVVNTSGTTVTWGSGDTFPPTIVGDTVTINAVTYTVDSWIDSQTIILTSSAGSQTLVAFTYTQNVNAVAGDYIGTYFAVLNPNSNVVNVSRSFDGLTWDALDYQDRTTRVDRFKMIKTVGSNLWLFGTNTSEVWSLGTGSFPLDVIPGSIIDYGVWAPFTVAAAGDSMVLWLSASDRGICQVMMAQGVGAGAVKRVSTDALERIWRGYSTATDATAYVYNSYGHTFYVLDFPTGNATFVYDITAGMWHRRSNLSGTTHNRQLQQFATSVFKENIVQSGTTGKVYQQREDVYQDDGGDIEYYRTAAHLSNEQEWTFYDRFQLDANVGEGSTTPVVTLEISNDGGNTFPNAITGTWSSAGEYTKRIIFNRLGRSRDRVFRMKYKGANPVSWVGAYLRVRKGTGA